MGTTLQNFTKLHKLKAHNQWHSMAQHGTAWHSMAQHGTAWHSMAQHGTAWHSMAQHKSFHVLLCNLSAVEKPAAHRCPKLERRA